jgi:hypothetical protein
MTELPDYHGPHFAAPRADAERIEWGEPVLRFHRVRILRHSCACRWRIYKFCTSAGLAWVRRTDRIGSTSTVKETQPTPFNEVRKLWDKLLTGEAR